MSLCVCLCVCVCVCSLPGRPKPLGSDVKKNSRRGTPATIQLAAQLESSHSAARTSLALSRTELYEQKAGLAIVAFDKRRRSGTPIQTRVDM